MLHKPVGIDDFKELIDKNYSFVDKTLFIKELDGNRSKVSLILRPRRFGKTLNMSMLKYFFDITIDSKNIFKDTLIAKEEIYKEINSKPVIFLSFKDAKGSKEEIILSILENLFELFNYYVKTYNVELEDLEKIKYDKLLTTIKEFNNKNLKHLRNLLYILSGILYRIHNKPVILLIDEYDTPIIQAYNSNFYKDDFKEFINNSKSFKI